MVAHCDRYYADISTMLSQCWVNVGPVLNQRWVDINHNHPLTGYYISNPQSS